MNARELNSQIEARLKTLVPNDLNAVYRGGVPAELPRDSLDRVYPYAVLWETPGMGDTRDAEDLSGNNDGGSVNESQITIASGDPGWTSPAAVAVKNVLDHWLPEGNVERLRASQTWAPVLLDTEVLPNRWYLVLVFRAAFI